MGAFFPPMIVGAVAQSGNTCAALILLAVTHLAIVIPASGVIDARDRETDALPAHG